MDVHKGNNTIGLSMMFEPYSTEANTPYWKMASYHHPIIPNAEYDKRNDLYDCWATNFDDYHFQLIMESHTHTMKTTYPISQDRLLYSNFDDAGFVRDDACGSVYIGEGNWAAPQRGEEEHRPRTWTRQLEDIRSFFYIQVNKETTKIYSPMFNNAAMVENVDTALDDIQGSDLPLGVTLYETLYESTETSDVYTLTNTTTSCLEYYIFEDTTTGPIGLIDNTVQIASLYPNPVADQLFIILDQPVQYVTIELYDALGKRCKNVKIRQLSSNEYAIDAKSISASVGFVIVKYNGNAESHKFIKVK